MNEKKRRKNKTHIANWLSNNFVGRFESWYNC